MSAHAVLPDSVSFKPLTAFVDAVSSLQQALNQQRLPALTIPQAGAE